MKDLTFSITLLEPIRIEPSAELTVFLSSALKDSLQGKVSTYAQIVHNPLEQEIATMLIAQLENSCVVSVSYEGPLLESIRISLHNRIQRNHPKGQFEAFEYSLVPADAVLEGNLAFEESVPPDGLRVLHSAIGGGIHIGHGTSRGYGRCRIKLSWHSQA